MFSANSSQVSNDANYIEDVFSTYLYTGNGSTQTITNGIDLSTKGGLVWMKNRTTGGASAGLHVLTDTVTGATKQLCSNNADPQYTYAGYGLTNFGTTGFTVTDVSGGGYYVNGTSQNYASWTFREQPKFFDVVTYTGTGSARTIAHNLGSAPGCMIIKSTTAATSWAVYHRSLGQGNFLTLDSTNSSTASTAIWNNTSPTSTVFSIGTSGAVNASGQTFVAYLFAHDAGGFGLTGTDNVISCGSYTGNGSATGPTVTLGYEPQWLLTKRTDLSADWQLVDTMRGMSSAYNRLFPNSSVLEDFESDGVTPTATGFKLTGVQPTHNASGGTYIYIAIRRGPMKVPTSGTSVFLPTASSAAQGTVITTGWPVDQQLIAVRAGNALNFRAISRLQGVSTTNTAGSTAYLSTASTSPESANSTAGRDWNNTGYDIPDVFNTTSCIYYAFQRSPSFMDVVCYTGNSSANTINHNLGVTPELFIFKSRNNTGSWFVTDPINNAKVLDLSTTAASATSTTITAKSATSFSFSGTATGANNNAYTYVAYLFATCAGVSKVGSYTGTGTTKQVDCGFTGGARFVLIKRTDSTGDWYVWDTARGIVAGNDPYLLLNSTAAEVTSTDYIDTYSAGFEISSTAPAAINASGGTFIFLAIA